MYEKHAFNTTVGRNEIILMNILTIFCIKVKLFKMHLNVYFD